ncbi:MAG: hypothetical protein JNG86_16465 [Verrucomicrobiaceae bacterium]|nr:hypothetical protein [Verrucomicrobiaceae bacterium]
MPLWLLVLLSRQWHLALEEKSAESVISYLNLEMWIEVVALLLAAAVVWRCVSADSPSNTDSFSLTRPIGQMALWCGKLLFLFSALLVPLWLAIASGWRGFDLHVAQWAVMSGTMLLAAGLFCAVAGALTSLTSSSRQVIVLAVLTVIAAGLWLALEEKWSEPEKISTETRHTQLCGSLIAAIFAFTGCMAAWYCATVPRRRFRAVGILLFTALVSTVIAQTWQKDWITRSEKAYANAAKLAVKVGKADPADKTPGRALWPTLRLTGLGKDEVATILEFAPVIENKPWPPEGSHTDTPNEENGHASWLHHDHTRALFKHYPASTLWRDQIYNNSVYNGRKPLDALLQSLRMKRDEAIQRPWRLRLVIHEMKRIATQPWRQFWTQENGFLISPGVRLEFNPFSWHHEAWEMHGYVRRMSSALLPIAAFRPASGRKGELDHDFFFVLEDKELNETHARSLSLSSREPQWVNWRNQSEMWLQHENQSCQLRLWSPREQQVILQRTHDEWIDAQIASIWHAEERGIVELELTPEQMSQVLMEPGKEKR